MGVLNKFLLRPFSLIKEGGCMAEKRRFRRISVYIKIKELDYNPMGESKLLNISAFGA